MRRTKKVLSILLVFLLMTSNISFNTKSYAVEELPKLNSKQQDFKEEQQDFTKEERTNKEETKKETKKEEITKIESERNHLKIDEEKPSQEQVALDEQESSKESKKQEQEISLEENLDQDTTNNLQEENLQKETGIQEEVNSLQSEDSNLSRSPFLVYPEEEYGDFKGPAVKINQFEYFLDDKTQEAELRFVPFDPKELTIPDTIVVKGKEYKVTSIFLKYWSLQSLEKVYFPQYLKIIKDSSFSYTKLREVNFPDSLEVIGESAFYASKIQGHLNIGGSIRYIGWTAFSKTNISFLTLGDTVKILKGHAFSYNEDLEEIDFGHGVERMENLSFANNPKLKHVELPDSLIFLGVNSFIDDINLETIFIPESVEKVEGSTFYNCPNFKYIYTPKGNVDRLREILLNEYGAIQFDTDKEDAILTARDQEYEYSEEVQTSYEVIKGEEVSLSVADAEKQYRYITLWDEKGTSIEGGDWLEIPPTYEWYKDGVLLEEQTEQTLSLKQMKPSDVGTYYVVVNGQKLEDIRIDMKAVPSLTLESDVLTTYVGDQIQYTITLRNEEYTKAWKDVVVKSMISSEGLYVKGSLQFDGYVMADDHWSKEGLLLSVGDLQGGQTHKIVYSIQVTSMPQKGILKNEAVASSSNAEDVTETMDTEILKKEESTETEKPKKKDTVEIVPIKKKETDQTKEPIRRIHKENNSKKEGKSIPKTGDYNITIIYGGIFLLSFSTIIFLKRKETLNRKK